MKKQFTDDDIIRFLYNEMKGAENDAFLEALEKHEAFRELFMAELRTAPYLAFRWETPPLHSGNTNQAFECLLHDSPDLDVRADPTDFEEYFRPAADVVSFDNLGRDALLVVPCPASKTANYSHIGAFHRTAPESQQSKDQLSVPLTATAARISAQAFRRVIASLAK